MSDVENLGIANVVITEESDELSPAISFGGAAINGNSQTGLFGGYNSFGAAVKGQQIVNLDENGLAIISDRLTMVNDVCIINGAGAPTNGTTGDNFAGTGSLYIDITAGDLYINQGLITNPTWVLVGPPAGP